MTTALSIRQPWAYFILRCGKDVENRDWFTRFRGPVLIHAAKTMTRADYEYAVDFAKSIGVADIPSMQQLERGGIIGAADINDCVIESDSPWFFGKYGFILSNIRPLPFMPCKGQLGFFEVEALS